MNARRILSIKSLLLEKIQKFLRLTKFNINSYLVERFFLDRFD